MSDRLHGILEDLGAEIGFTATTTLVAWYGGTSLYVPASIRGDHPICKVIGPKAFALLVAEYGGTQIDIPSGKQAAGDSRDRRVAELIGQNVSREGIASLMGLSQRRVRQIRARLEASGILPTKSPVENAGANAGGKSPVGNTP